MKYSVGLPKLCQDFTECIIKNSDHIYEVYFSWGDFACGRSSQTHDDEYASWELMDIQRNALSKISENNIHLNLLFNGNCYGAESLSKSFFNKIGNTVDYIISNYNLKSVTTTSPLIAKFIKNNFSDIKTRASVNMEIGSIEGMEYLSDVFDGYYMKREINRDLSTIKKLYSWCKDNGKHLFMLANSGCLNFCSSHIFHDNLVSHEAEISKMDNAFSFEGTCKKFLRKKKIS